MTFTLIDRYVVREYSLSFFFSTIAFISIFNIIDLTQRIDFFIDNKIAVEIILQFYWGKSAETLELLIPLAALLSALYSTGKLNKNSEIIAIKSTGISMYRFMVPYLFFAVMLTGLNFYLSNWFVPETKKNRKEFEEKFLKMGDGYIPTNRSNFNLYDSPTRFLFVQFYSDGSKTFSEVSIQNFEHNRMHERLDVKRMNYDTSTHKWILSDVIIRKLEKDKILYTYLPRIDTLKLHFTPDDILRSKQSPEEMTLPEHYNLLLLRRIASFGGTSEIEVKMHEKIAFPFACFIIPFIAVPLATQKRKSGLALETGISVALGFAYFGLQKSFATIGYSGDISPLMAAWFPNVLFLVVGIFMLYVIRK